MQTLSQHGMVIKVIKDDNQGYLRSSSLLDKFECAFFSPVQGNKKKHPSTKLHYITMVD